MSFDLFGREIGQGGSGITYRVSFTQWPDVQEGERLVGLEDLHGRDFSWNLSGTHFATELIGRYP